jgi:hypothetical protein
VPAASPAQEDSDTDEAAATTTPNVSELQPTSEYASEPAEPGALEALEPETELQLELANDNVVSDPLPATSIER